MPLMTKQVVSLTFQAYDGRHDLNWPRCQIGVRFLGCSVNVMLANVVISQSQSQL